LKPVPDDVVHQLSSIEDAYTRDTQTMLLWIKERDLELLEGIEAYLKIIPTVSWTIDTKLLRSKMVTSMLSRLKNHFIHGSDLPLEERSELNKRITQIQIETRKVIQDLTDHAEKEREKKTPVRVTEKQVLRAAKAAKPLNAMLVALFFYAGVESKEVISMTWEDALSVIPEALKSDLFPNSAITTGKVFENMTIQNISQRVRRAGLDIGVHMTPSILRRMNQK
jgi:integrase